MCGLHPQKDHSNSGNHRLKMSNLISHLHVIVFLIWNLTILVNFFHSFCGCCLLMFQMLCFFSLFRSFIHSLVHSFVRSPVPYVFSFFWNCVAHWDVRMCAFEIVLDRHIYGLSLSVMRRRCQSEKRHK